MKKQPRGRRDPLVPVNQEVLRALLEERKWTIAMLSRRTGELEQTLDHIVNSVGARCRKSRRAKIAKALQVPQELLAGESFPVPGGFMLPDGFEFRYSARTQLAASRLITRVRNAYLRDLRTQSSGGPSPNAPVEVVEGLVLSTFSEFMMIGEWRKRLIEWKPGEHSRRGYTEPATVNPGEKRDIRVKGADREGWVDWEATTPRRERDPDHEAAILGLIRGVEHILEPWFRDTARLNYRAIRDFVHLPGHPFATANELTSATLPFAILPPSRNAGDTAK